MGSFLTDDLVCQAGIDSADDVREKTIAISSFGGTSHAAALLALQTLDLGSADATITQIGGQGARIAAIEGGSVDCAVVDTNLRADMEAQGFSIATSILIADHTSPLKRLEKNLPTTATSVAQAVACSPNLGAGSEANLSASASAKA